MKPTASPVPLQFEESRHAPDVEAVRRSTDRWRWLLAFTVMVMTALIWGVWAETTTHENHQALSAAARRQGNLSVAVGHYLTRALGNADAVAQYLSGVHSSPGSNFPAQLRERGRVNTLLAEALACGEDGSSLSSRSAGDASAFARWCPHWLQEAPARARTFPARPVKSGDLTLVPLLTRVAGTADRPAGVIALLVDVRDLLGLLQDYSIPDETVVLVAGPDDQPRARWHNVDRMKEQRAPEVAVLPEVLAAGTLGQPVTVEGRQILASARRVQAFPLTVFVGTSVADTLAGPRARSFYYAIACTVATLVIATFAWLLLRLQNQASQTAESLGRARERLQVLNNALEGKVRARTGELEAALRDLEAFSYSVAHDVRAPIAAIQGFASALEPAVAAAGDARSSHYLRRIVANATQMSELTESLLELGKLSRAPVATTRVDVSTMAHEVLAGLREQSPKRAVETRVQDGLTVRGDRVLLRQVLENLLGNAWKFSAARSPAVITVTGQEEDGWKTIVIRDNGEGFDSSQASEVFKPFRRMHAAGAFPGTGIGLAMVERILRLHGGRTWIQSSPEKGTSVFIALPVDEDSGVEGDVPGG